MENPIQFIEDLLNNIPDENSKEYVFISQKDGSCIPMNEMIGKTVDMSKYVLEERSAESSIKNVIDKLFEGDKITIKSYRRYHDIMLKLSDFVERNLESQVKSNLKTHGIGSIGEVEFMNLKTNKR